MRVYLGVGVYAERLADGAVRLTNDLHAETSEILDATTWCGVVTGLSGAPTDEAKSRAFHLAQVVHGIRVCDPPIPIKGRVVPPQGS